MTPNVIRNINKLKHQIFSDFKGGNFFSLSRQRDSFREKERDAVVGL